MEPLQSLLETENAEEQSRNSSSPLSNMRRKITSRPTLTPRQSERALLSDSTSSSEKNSDGKLSGIVRWFRGSKDRCSIDLESGPDLSSMGIRKGSLQSKAKAEGIGKSIQKAKRRLGRIGLGKGKKKTGGTEEVSGGCKF